MAAVILALGLAGVLGLSACANLSDPTTTIVSVEAGYGAALAAENEYLASGKTDPAVVKRATNTRRQTPALLKGIIFTETGAAMTPAATKKGTRLYRYYVSMDLIRNRSTGEASGPLRLPAGMVEGAVVGEVRRMISAPEITARTIRAIRDESPTINEQAIVSALKDFDQLWAALYPAEQTRIIHLLVERVTVGEGGIAVDLRHEGLGSVLRDMMTTRQKEVCA